MVDIKDLCELVCLVQISWVAGMILARRIMERDMLGFIICVVLSASVIVGIAFLFAAIA